MPTNAAYMNITLSLQEPEGRRFKERESKLDSYIYLLFHNPTLIEYGFPVLTRNNLESSKRKKDRQTESRKPLPNWYTSNGSKWRGVYALFWHPPFVFGGGVTAGWKNTFMIRKTQLCPGVYDTHIHIYMLNVLAKSRPENRVWLLGAHGSRFESFHPYTHTRSEANITHTATFTGQISQPYTPLIHIHHNTLY